MKRPARHSRNAPRGMTLIEIVVALMIVAVLFAAVTFSVGALTGAKAKESSTELAGTIRALYDTAALSGKTCRIVFTLPEERDEDTPASWRAECAAGGTTASAKRDDELADARKKAKDKVEEKKDDRFRRLDSDDAPTLQELQAQEEKRVNDAAQYSNFSSDDVAEKTLPSNVRVSVWTQKQREATKHGIAYLYFFPQGFTERAQVWLRQGDNVWTLAISPLTGKTKIYAEDLEVPRS